MHPRGRGPQLEVETVFSGGSLCPQQLARTQQRRRPSHRRAFSPQPCLFHHPRVIVVVHGDGLTSRCHSRSIHRWRQDTIRIHHSRKKKLLQLNAYSWKFYVCPLQACFYAISINGSLFPCNDSSLFLYAPCRLVGNDAISSLCTFTM